MLAGRKLLLADDSITIQKVVELTFADEGVSVVCVNNGREAIEKLAEFTPDVVLADVFMPQVNGYEVCEYIKQNPKLKHIPVMLLVGSFEPYDEAEARRVGANDTLTKPFQSIKRLLEKVGLLVAERPPEELIPTAELPKPDVPEPEVEKLTTAELEITTADTRPLPAELQHVVEGAAAPSAHTQAAPLAPVAPVAEVSAPAAVDDSWMESKVLETVSEAPTAYEGAGEVLLDLGTFQKRSSVDDDFVLDIDLDEAPEASPLEPAFAVPSFYARNRYGSGSGSVAGPSYADGGWSATTITADLPAPTSDQLAKTQEFRADPRPAVHEAPPPAVFPEVQVVEAEESGAASAELSSSAASPAVSASPSAPVASAPASDVSLQQLSPEMIDAIARRVVEHMSKDVVQEIAWEVVPQLAELLIKRQLEEKSS